MPPIRTTPSRRLLVAACLVCAGSLGVAGAGLPAAAETTASDPPPGDAPGGDQGVDVALAEGGTVTITPAGADAEDEWEPVTAEVARIDAEDPDLAFRAEVADDGVAVIAEIAAPLAEDLAFDIDLPAGHRLQEAGDGTIDIVGPGGISSSGFEAPWAHDAAGRDLATEYALDGNRIVQRVDLDEDTAYPVTADPKLTTGWVTGTVYFNIPETIEIGDTSWFSSACAALTRFGPVGAAVAVACAVAWNSVAYTARKARREGKCLKLKFPLTIVTGAGVVVPGTYGGGYCTK